MLKINGTAADPVYLDENGNKVSLPKSAAELERALHAAWRLLATSRQESRPSTPPRIEPKPYYTVNEVASMLCWSRNTVIRRFANEKGVLVGGNVETVRDRRKYRQLQIPPHVIARFVNRLSVK